MPLPMTGEQEPDDPLLRAVAEHWAEIFHLADDEQRGRLRGLIDGTAEPDPAEALAALSDELLDLLPPDHPVIQVMRTRVMFAGQETDLPDRTDAETKLAGALRWLGGQVLSGNAGHGNPDDDPGSHGPLGHGPLEAAARDDFDRQVEDRLLHLPSLSVDDVRRNHADPDDDGLIRLQRPDHVVQLPAFQFTPVGTPWPVVQEVNVVLDAAADPWGVTCWWVDPHEGLAATPADLLGQGHDDLLRRAAAAVGKEC